jgi:hypothetical protein
MDVTSKPIDCAGSNVTKRTGGGSVRRGGVVGVGQSQAAARINAGDRDTVGRRHHRRGSDNTQILEVGSQHELLGDRSTSASDSINVNHCCTSRDRRRGASTTARAVEAGRQRPV